jgi:hypothetical protein
MSTRVNKKQNLTEEQRQRLAKKREYTRKWRENKKAAEKAKENPKAKKAKASKAKKAKASKAKAKKLVTKKKEKNEERLRWLERKRTEKIYYLGAETIKLAKEGEKIRRQPGHKTADIPEHMQKAMCLVRNLDRKLEKGRNGEKTTIQAPLTSVAVVSRRTALDELSSHYASEDEFYDAKENDDDADEIFNATWRPFQNLTV